VAYFLNGPDAASSIAPTLIRHWNFPGLAISNAKNNINTNIFRKLLWFEIAAIMMAVLKINLLCYLL